MNKFFIIFWSRRKCPKICAPSGEEKFPLRDFDLKDRSLAAYKSVAFPLYLFLAFTAALGGKHFLRDEDFDLLNYSVERRGRNRTYNASVDRSRRERNAR